MPTKDIEKMCKAVCKKNIYLHVESSPQKSIFRDLIKKYTLINASKKKSEATCSRKRTVSDTEMVQVPKDHKKRQIFYMEQSLEIAKSNLTSVPESNGDASAPFRQMLPQSCIYNLVSRKHKEYFNPLRKDMLVLDDVEKFVKCIIKLSNCSVLVTSFDLFGHNQPLNDDCAFGLISSDVSHIPIAKIKSKNNTDKQFKEVSVFIGLYELLIVGGYVFYNNSTIPFLGSSLGNITINDTSVGSIHTLSSRNNTTKTTRLLNQYLKRCSQQLWEYHSIYSFSQGFYPIAPTNYLNRPSQKYRDVNIHHFASKVLGVLVSPAATKKEDIDNLWRIMQRLPVYAKITKEKTPKPINFAQLLESADNEHGVYFLFLINIAARIEANVPCFMLGVYSFSEARSVTLEIMKRGLKDEIRKQQAAIIHKQKNEIN